MTSPLIDPPAQLPEIQRGVWCALPADDPTATYLASTVWDQPQAPAGWEAARLSHAVYLFRETRTRWAVAAKYYTIKTDAEAAEHHARRELESTARVRAFGLAGPALIAPRPLVFWRGVLFLEYIDGLTLENVIAVRRNRPGSLRAALALTAQLLATLHTHGAQPDQAPTLNAALAELRRIMETLTRHGILADDPIVTGGLHTLIARWAGAPVMLDYVPAHTHGDATTSNFVFPWSGGVAGIDWERFRIGDPAADVGRLLAEVTHSLKQHGGRVAEALPELEYTLAAYDEALPAGHDRASLMQRVRFYRALSTLRIARNGWVSRLDRTALVAEALALLAEVP